MKLEVNENNVRLDVYLTKNTELSRTKIQKLIKEGNVLVNNVVCSANYKVKENDIIEIENICDENIDTLPEKMDLDIVYEDDYLLIINKKSGVVVHPAVGNYNHTLVNGLLYHFNTLSKKNTIRPGIVHRLDKDTSGLMVVAKDDKTHELLADMIKHKKVERKYVALVWGVIKHEKGTINAPIGRDFSNRQKYTVTDVNSKESVTHFKVLKRFKDATLVECILETGRTHQIRVHMDYIGHPVVNDPTYGKKKIINDYGQMLHAEYLGFNHPITGKFMEFEALPEREFNEILDMFRNS